MRACERLLGRNALKRRSETKIETKCKVLVSPRVRNARFCCQFNLLAIRMSTQLLPLSSAPPICSSVRGFAFRENSVDVSWISKETAEDSSGRYGLRRERISNHSRLSIISSPIASLRSDPTNLTRCIVVCSSNTSASAPSCVTPASESAICPPLRRFLTQE